MLKSFRKSKTNIFAWALLALLVVGLIGLYGTRSGGLVAQDVAAVGDEGIDAQDYYNALTGQMRAFSQRTGQSLNMTQARAFGLDRSVLSGLISTAALNSEAGELGISAGDQTIREQLLATPAFLGVDGAFDRSTYEFALDNANLTPSEFDETLRQGVARDLLRAGIAAGVSVPDAATRAVLAYIGEERSFNWVRLDRTSLGTSMPVPGSTDLRDFFDDNGDMFMVPTSRQITYVKLTPDMLLARFESSEDTLRKEYEERSDTYSRPERRILDRIVFGTAEESSSAKQDIDSGATTFDAVATDRGLSGADIDIGAVAAASLDAEARALVFGSVDTGVVGPMPTSLGPALFRINAILAASETPFEDVREGLNRELVLPQALDRIAEVTNEVEDLLAGGASLEEVASETDFVLETVSLWPGLTDGLAGDPLFQREAFTAEKGEERDIFGLSDGGVAALRIDDIIAAHPPEFADVEADVRASWEATRAVQLLIERAEVIKEKVAAGESLADISETSFLTLNVQEDILRAARVGTVPEGVVDAVFDLQEGGVAIIPLPDGAVVAHLSGIKGYDATAPDQETAIATLQQRQVAETQSDIFTYFSQAIQDRDGVVVNTSLFEQILSRIP